MFNCKLAICADSVVRDVETNTFSVHTIMEEVSAHSFPLALYRLSALFYITREEQDPAVVDAELLLTHNGVALHQFDQRITFEEHLLTRWKVAVGGVVIPGPGALRMSLFVENDELGGWTIEVKALTKAQVELPLGGLKSAKSGADPG